MIHREKKFNSVRIQPGLGEEKVEMTLNRLQQAVFLRDCQGVRELTERMVMEGSGSFQDPQSGVDPRDA